MIPQLLSALPTRFHQHAVAGMFLLLAAHASGQSGTTFLAGRNLDFLSLHNGSLYWKSGCLGVGPTSIIERAPAGGNTVATYFNPPTCDGSSVRSANLAITAAQRVFWATQDGRIVSLDAGATPGTPPTLVSTMGTTALPQVVTIAASADYVYWAESQGEFREGGNLYRAPIAGGDRELVFNFTQATGGGVVALHALGNNGITFGESVLVKRSFGRLTRISEQLALPGQPSWTEATLVNSIDTFSVVGSRTYYAETSSGNPTLIKSRATSGLANIQTHATVSAAGFPYVSDVTADSTAVYWREVRSGTGPISRQLFSGGSPDSITVNLPEIANSPLFLVSDGRGLYWRANQTEIRTLPVNAGAVVYDVAARALEVVQTVQGPANDVPLVADKTTWVRAFGRFSVSGASTSQLDRLTLTHLHGTRDGAPLPGSPLQPAGGNGILLTIDALRDEEAAGAWFRLPAEWTAAGTTVLRAEFNADRVVAETNFANNSADVTVNFQRCLPIHLKAYPLRTNQGTIGNYSSDYQPVLDLAEALLPTPQVTIEFGGVTIEEWNPPLPWDFGPYELSKSDDDSGWVLFKLGVRAVVSWASAGRSVHDMAFFRPFEQRAMNGIGRLGFPKILLSYMRLGAGASGFNTPLGGVTLAHEMGHNYGRDHVDCGGPADPDPDYPYNSCSLAPASSYQGWNPISRRLIRANDAGDLMSYRGNAGDLGQRWTSDYTWRAIFNELKVGPSPRPRAAGDEFTTPILLGGVVSPTGAAALHPAMRLPDAAAVAAASALVEQAEDKVTWRFVLRRANNSIVETIPAAASPTTDNGGILLYALMEEPVEATRVTLERNNAPGIPQATLAGGGAPPSLAITAPAAGTVLNGSFTLRWEAADPEGLPLRFQVRYSHDQGTTWRALADDVRQNELVIDTTGLPGGSPGRSLIEVLASDGLRTAVARSAFFTVPARNPRPVIVLETERGRVLGASPAIAAGESIVLRGRASDAEDVSIPAASLAWTVNGPNSSTRTATGREFFLRDLRPGNYSVTLRATDSDALTGTTTAAFSVRRIAVAEVSPSPLIDGFADDPAYLACLHPQFIRYATGTPASVRMVLAGTTLCVSVTGLQNGTLATGDFVALAFDPNNSADTATQATDIRFVARRNGSFFSAKGDGAGGFSANQSLTGFTVRIKGTSTRWQAEFAIPLSTLGAEAARVVKMNAGHFQVTGAADDHQWFGAAAASWNRPRDWAETRLASDPDDPADLDLDGMADTWERTHFGSTVPDGTDDADGDNQTDAEEYQSATNPVSAASRFAITSVEQEGAFYRLRWPSAIGCVYDVESSRDLRTFEPFATGLVGTGDELSTFIDPSLPEAGSFFRVVSRRTQ